LLALTWSYDHRRARFVADRARGRADRCGTAVSRAWV